MPNKYEAACLSFGIGKWSMDCPKGQISLDTNLASILDLNGSEFPCDVFLEKVTCGHRQYVKRIMDSLPEPSVRDIRFDMSVGGTTFHAEVIFDNAEPDKPLNIGGSIRVSKASDEDNGRRDKTYPAAPKLINADNINFFSKGAGQAIIGYYKWDTASGQGFSTERWSLNMGLSSDEETKEIYHSFGNVHPEDREMLIETFKKMENGDMSSAQCDVRIRSGESWRWLVLSASISRRYTSEVSAEITAINMDITQYMEMQMQLTDTIKEMKAMEVQREAVLNSLSSALIYIDTDYMVHWKYDHALQSIPINRNYIPGEKCYRIAFNRDTPCEKCSFTRMLRSGRMEVGQHTDECGATLQISANPIRDPEGNLIAGILQVEDITKRVNQEMRMNELNYVMDAILNNIPVYLFVKNPNKEFRYIYWNKAMADYTKIPVEKVLGNTDIEVFPRALDAEKFRRDDLTLLETRRNIECQEEYVDAHGATRVVNTLKTLIPTGDKIPWLLGVSWDITELKNTEKELIKAKEKAEESDQFKSMFLANMSHEIRTPLNAIVGFSELLMDDTSSREERQEYIAIMQKNTQLLLQLISDILDLSRIESQDMELNFDYMDLHTLCGRIAMSTNLHSKRNVPVIFDDEHPRYIVFNDEKRVQQIITNLVNNAIKFTTEGSVQIGYKLLGDTEIEISVTDSGIGIPKEKINSVFERFVKLNTFIQGTGLGLSICKSLTESIGGRIGVESEEGCGSRFWFTLPYDPKQTGTDRYDL